MVAVAGTGLPAWMPMTQPPTADRSSIAGGATAISARLLSPLRRPVSPPLWVGILVAAALIAGETLLVLLLHHFAPDEAFEMVYMVGVLAVSAIWGLPLAIATSVVSAALLAYAGNWPSGHFAPFNLENGAIVVVFLIVALLTNFLAGMARSRAIEAEQRRRAAEGVTAMLQESREELSALVEQQQALRRAATLVARGVSPSEAFAAVTKELGLLLNAEITRLVRFEADGSATVLAVWKRTDEPVPIGRRIAIDDIVAAPVRRTGKPARMTEQSPPGLPGGSYSAVGAPIMVGGMLWGAVTALSPQVRPMPEGAEARMAEFTDLVGIAIANAQARADLIASRARVVAAADDARRRLERDLHDGAQQKLVALRMQLRQAEDQVSPDPHDLKQRLSHIGSELTELFKDLQELSRGIHPGILRHGGLRAALNTLARRSTIPVTLDVDIDWHLPEPVEVAAYYVVAEALSNAAKHAKASEVRVAAHCDDKKLDVSIRDDGMGGADSRKGSGLIGLTDRVEALGGRIHIQSPSGAGTSLDVTVPLES
jgi:signal transduction histidine kinase